MKVTRVLVFVLCLMFASFASAQIWPNLEGAPFTGVEDVQLNLVSQETPWSIPELAGAYWVGQVVGDSATLLLCLDDLHIGSRVINFGYCTELTWNPAAHAYVRTEIPVNGVAEAQMVAVKTSEIIYLDGHTEERGGTYWFVMPPEYEWRHYRWVSIPFDLGSLK